MGRLTERIRRSTSRYRAGVARELREARYESGMTQAVLARRSGVGRRTIARMECARCIPAPSTLTRIDSVLD